MYQNILINAHTAKTYSEILLFLPFEKIYNSAWVVCKQVVVLRSILVNSSLAWKWPDPIDKQKLFITG